MMLTIALHTNVKETNENLNCNSRNVYFQMMAYTLLKSPCNENIEVNKMYVYMCVARLACRNTCMQCLHDPVFNLSTPTYTWVNRARSSETTAQIDLKWKFWIQSKLTDMLLCGKHPLSINGWTLEIAFLPRNFRRTKILPFRFDFHYY